jgi:hypothetical protein
MVVVVAVDEEAVKVELVAVVADLLQTLVELTSALSLML